MPSVGDPRVTARYGTTKNIKAFKLLPIQKVTFSANDLDSGSSLKFSNE